MSQSGGDAVAVAGGACGGVGSAAGRENHPICGNFLILRSHPGNMPVLGANIPDTGSFHGDLPPARSSALQAVQNVDCGSVRHREIPGFPARPSGGSLAPQKRPSSFPAGTPSWRCRETARSGGRSAKPPAPVQLLVTLQRPLPVISSFSAADGRFFPASSILLPPLCRRELAANMPCRAAADHDTVIAHQPSTRFSYTSYSSQILLQIARSVLREFLLASGTAMATINALTILSGATRESTRRDHVAFGRSAHGAQLLPKGDSFAVRNADDRAPRQSGSISAPLVVVEE